MSNKSYMEKRAEEIFNECNVNEIFEKYYNLGITTAYGYILYMLDKDFDKSDIKKVIIGYFKDDTQSRCDMFGVWGELYDKE